MKANELRIGNLVSDIHASDNFYAQVKKLDYTRCYYGEFYSAYTDLKPIPLTEEWLVKFGFEKGSLYFKKGLLDCVEISEEGRFNIYYGEDENNSISITYVHQLQNLYFALTGEELTIG